MPTNPHTPPTGPPIPVFVEYDGATWDSRTRRWFPEGLDDAARAFFVELAREGRRPRVVTDDDIPAPEPMPKPKRERTYRPNPAPLPVPASQQNALFDNPPEQLPD